MSDIEMPMSVYFNDGWGGGRRKDFFGSEILAKKDFFVSMKDTSIFGGHKKHRDFCVLFLSSAQIINNN